jgi:hypothetical protein
MIIGRPRFDYEAYLKCLQVFLPCEHPRAEPRRAIKKGNHQEFYRMQCPDCGAKLSNHLKYSDVDEFRTLFGKPKDWDEAKFNSYWARRNRIGAIIGDHLQNERHRIWWEQYVRYIRSSTWQARRTRIMIRDKLTCQSCHLKPATQVHHKTYERLGEELDEDLVALCFECHKAEHPQRFCSAVSDSPQSVVAEHESSENSDDSDLPW